MTTLGYLVIIVAAVTATHLAREWLLHAHLQRAGLRVDRGHAATWRMRMMRERVRNEPTGSSHHHGRIVWQPENNCYRIEWSDGHTARWCGCVIPAAWRPSTASRSRVGRRGRKRNEQDHHTPTRVPRGSG